MNTQPVPEAWPVVVALPAEIDIANARDIRNQLTGAALRAGVTIVIADMTATTFCDSTGVSALILAHQRAVCGGAELRLLNPDRNVRRVLELTGTDQVLMLCESLKEAVMPAPAGGPATRRSPTDMGGAATSGAK